MTGASPRGPKSPHEATEKLKRPGCSPEGTRLPGRVLRGRPQNPCSAVPTLPGLAIALGNEAGLSPEQSPPKLDRAFEKPQVDCGLLCHPKSLASCHWPLTWGRDVIHCTSEKPSGPSAFLWGLGDIPRDVTIEFFFIHLPPKPMPTWAR